MIKQDKLTELYFIIEEFNKQFEAQTPKRIGKSGANIFTCIKCSKYGKIYSPKPFIETFFGKLK